MIALCFSVEMASSGESARKPEVKTSLPKDVSAFVERRMGCDHWSGEDAYDAARGRQIAAAIKELRCDRLDADEKRLLKRYGGMPEVRKALDLARDPDS